jgi:site-specific DNA recombinase
LHQAAPIGYERGKINGKKSWVMNEHGKLLRKAFMWKATEMVSNEEARERLAKLGLQISHQQMSSIFRNPFYCGLLSHNLLEGQVVEGNHEKLISREIFLKVNEVQNRNIYGYTTTEENDAIPLKRFLRCEYCGSFLRGYMVKAKGIWYYKCNTRGCNCNRNAEKMHDKFEDILGNYTLRSESLIPLIEKQMLSTYYRFTEEEGDDKLIYKSRIKEIDKEIEWQKARVKKGEIPYNLYAEFLKEYKGEKKKIAEELEKGSNGVSNPERCVQFAVNYSSKLKPVWTSATYTEKQRFQFLLFPEGFFYNRVEDKCRTTGVNEAFAYIAELERFLQKCKSRTSLKNFDSAAWVASTGIEPVSKV